MYLEAVIVGTAAFGAGWLWHVVYDAVRRRRQGELYDVLWPDQDESAA